MSANAPITYLLRSGLEHVLSKTNPQFEIKYCLPIYDNDTDDYVMESRQDNPGTLPNEHDSSAPEDFSGAFFIRVPGAKYVLEPWPEDGDGCVAVNDPDGWKGNPPFSQYLSVNSSPGTKFRLPWGGSSSGGTKTIEGHVSGGSFSGTELNGPASLSTWDSSALYDCVRYMGTKNVDVDSGTVRTASYSIFLRSTENGTGDSVAGSIRFDKVLIFDGSGSVVYPIALVCLPNAVSLTCSTSNLEVSNSVTIEFNFGFDPTVIQEQSTTFDNSFWSRILTTSDEIRPVYFPGKVAVGEAPTGELGGMLNVLGGSVPAFNAEMTPSIYTTNIGQVGYSFAASHNYYSYRGYKNSFFTRIGQTRYFDLHLSADPSSSAPELDETIYVRSSIFMDSIGTGNVHDQSDIYVDNSMIVGSSIMKFKTDSSLIVGYNVTGRRQEGSSEDPYQSIKAKNTLIVGRDNNLGFACYGSTFAVEPDTSMIVGGGNDVYVSSVYQNSNTISSRTFVLGNENVVANGKACSETYVFGSSNSTSSTDKIGRKYIFGHGNTVNGDGTTYSELPGDVFVLGSGNTITASSMKFVFGRGMTVEGNDTYVFGGQTIPYYEISSNPIRLLSMSSVLPDPSLGNRLKFKFGYRLPSMWEAFSWETGMVFVDSTTPGGGPTGVFHPLYVYINPNDWH